MFSKTALFFAFAAISSIASAASPPGCLLGAVNQYQNPADISAVCKSKDATSKIAKVCGDATSDALSAFADVCNKAGVKVETKLPTSATGSIKPSGTTSSGNSTQSGVAHSTGGAFASSSASGSGSNLPLGPAETGTSTGSAGPALSTGAAGRLEVGAAALIAGLGVMAAAL